MPVPMNLDRKYEYRRKLPHYQKAGRALFITFRKNDRDPFPPYSRDAILQHCLYDHGTRFVLHAAVVMPDHVHLLLTPLPDEKGWPYGLPSILKRLKGTAARSVNLLAGFRWPRLARGILRSRIALAREFRRETGIHPPESGPTRTRDAAGRLSMVVVE